MSASTVDDTLKRIQSHKNVIGVIIVNNEGIPVRSSLDNSTTVQYASLLNMITTKACSAVRDLDPTDELILLRIRSKKNEIICAPENVKEMLKKQQDKKKSYFIKWDQ